MMALTVITWVAILMLAVSVGLVCMGQTSIASRLREVEREPPALEGPRPFCHCGGEWAPWERIKITEGGGYPFVGQLRVCERCGYTEVKRISL